MQADQIEAISQHWHHQHDHRNNGRKPKGRLFGRLSQRSHVRAANHIVIKVVEHQIGQHAAPDGDVVEDRPVRCVEGDLRQGKHIFNIAWNFT